MRKLTEQHKQNISKALKGHLSTLKGRKHTIEARRKISEAGKGRVGYWKGKKFSEEHKRKLRIVRKNRVCNYKDGTSKNFNEWQKRNRHKIGISKKYNSELGISYTKEYRRLKRQEYKSRKKGGGELTIKTIQLVYEDSVKQYGTLTCYLCLKPILFGKDHLEHKTPLSRGGTNEYRNLAIACQYCNCSKHDKTETEYRKEKIL